MVQRMSQPGLESPILKQIREDMDVYDREGKKIGEVESIYFGSVNEEADHFGQGPATSSAPLDPREDTWVEDLAEAFTGGDDIPDELRSRLLRQGYIRIDASGLFASDLYAMPEQIASVSGDDVHLNVTRDKLIKR